MKQLSSECWTAGLVVVLVWMAAMLSINISRPWTGHADYGGAVLAQAAHNNLRAGLGTTHGVPTGFYFGTLPIPSGGYYVHHPPGASLMITGVFALLGEHEWVARLVPIGCSLLSAVLLWLLVESCVGARAATCSAAVFALLPMGLYYGRIVDCGNLTSLTWLLAALVCMRYWHVTGKSRWWVATLVCFMVAMWMAWIADLLAVVAAGLLLLKRQRRDVMMSGSLLVTVAISVMLNLLYIHLTRPDALANLWLGINFRAGLATEEHAAAVPWWQWLKVSKFLGTFYDQDGSTVTWAQWLIRQGEYLGRPRLSALVWGLGIVGGICCSLRRNQSEGMRWLGWATLTFVITTLVYLLAFRNGSYVHDSWGFFFIVPLSMMGGLALDALIGQPRAIGTGSISRVSGWGLAMLILVILVLRANEDLRQLHQYQDRMIEDAAIDEPPDLVPSLGKVIDRTFPEDAVVLTNLPILWPPLEYYARHILVFGRSTPARWKAHIAEHPGPAIAGLVWLGAPGADELVATLRPGTRQIVQFGDLRFCLWKPDEKQISFKWDD